MHETTQRDGLVIGVDIGGTKIAAGLVDSTGKVLSQCRVPMVAREGASNALVAVTQAINVVSTNAKATGTMHLIRGIGICCPGPLDSKAGVILNPPNLPCWRNFPLAAELAHRYGYRVRVENDANAAALAEMMWGAGQGCRDIFYATIGTGIGTGIVVNGRLYEGRTGAAGEGGHLSIDYKGPICGCGKRGCIEAFASGPAIARRARAKLEDHPESRLLELARGETDDLSCEMVGEAYTMGDSVAVETVRETVSLLSFWLGNVIDLLDPEVVIIGGGVSSMLQPLFAEISAGLPESCVNKRCQEIPLVPARYGNDAGIVGGAALCSEKMTASS